MQSDKPKNCCSIKSCLKSYKYSENISLYRFPIDQERCRKWALACDRLDLYDYSLITGSPMNSSYYRVCSYHFDDDCFAGAKKKRLHRDAIPTLYLNEPTPGLKASLKDDSLNFTRPTSFVNLTLDTEQETSSGNKFKIINQQVSKMGTFTSTSTPTETNLSYGILRKRLLQPKITVHNNKVTILQKTLNTKNVNNRVSFSRRVTRKDLKQKLLKYLPTGLENLLSQQKKEGVTGYTDEFKRYCLKIYFLSPKCYSILDKFFAFPSKKTLFQITRNINLKPGVNDLVFSILKMKVDAMETRDKFCTISFDETSLKSHLYLNLTEDEVIGFEDSGNGKNFQSAARALVVTVKGIFRNWRQPLAYFLLKNSCPYSDLKGILSEIIVKLNAIGLTVKVCVSGMNANNTKLSNVLGVSPERPYFYVENTKIIYLFDCSHLIKAVRNILYSRDILYNESFISWQYIDKMHNINKNLSCRIVPNLTDSHFVRKISLKSKVNLATELLSASVANSLGFLISLGYIPPEALETQKFLELFNKLFNIFNSTSCNSPESLNDTSQQIQFLKDASTYLKSLNIVNKKGNVVTDKFRSIKHWQINVNGVLQLWETLKCEEYPFLPTNRLNQDALETIFGKRGASGSNCMPIKFHRAFKKSFTSEFFNPGRGNCSKDHTKILAVFKDFPCENIFADNRTEGSNRSINILKDVDYRLHKVEKNVLLFMCEYLIKKCLSVHSCSVCEQYADTFKEPYEVEITLLRSFECFRRKQLKTFGSLFMPHRNFFYYICELEDIFTDNFETYIVGKNIVKELVQLFNISQYKHPCDDFPYRYLLKLYCRTRIFYALKFVNKNFKSVNGSGEEHRKIIWR